MKLKKITIISTLLICVIGAATARKNIGSGGSVGPGGGTGVQCNEEYAAWQACINTPNQSCSVLLDALRACLAEGQQEPTD